MNIFRPNINDVSFFLSESSYKQLETIAWPKRTRKTRALTAFLMNLYIQEKLTSKQRKKILLLLVLISKRGIDSNTKCIGKKSFSFYAYHFRMTEVIEHLNNNKYPTAYAETMLSGFLGGFVKNIVNMANNNLTPLSIKSLNSLYIESQYYDNQEILKKIKSRKDVYMKDVFELINTKPVIINSLDINYKYKFSPSNHFSPQKNHLIHTAVINYNINVLKDLLAKGCSPYILNAHKRNILHLAEILDAPEIKSFILSLSLDIQKKLLSAKDIFGRTPEDIYNLKQSKSQAQKYENNESQTGGWDDSEAKEWSTDRIDIETVNYDKIDAKTLMKNYISIQKPVLIKNAIKQLPYLKTIFEKQNFESYFGNTIVSSGEIPYSSTYNKKENRGEFLKLKRALNSYVFCGIDKHRDAKLISEFDKFELTKKLFNDNWQLYAGPKETGAPLHIHTNAWNLLVYGKKRWIINPPLDGIYSIEPIRKWLKKNEKQYNEFIQEAGDLVYIPRYWSHGVINLKESIGVATEFTSPYIF